MANLASLILLLVGFVGVLAGVLLPRVDENKNSLVPIKRTGISGGAVLLVLGLLVGSYKSVPAGYRGVLLQFGALHGVLDEGAHLVLPIVQRVTLVEVRTQKSTDQASAASNDLQTVTTKVAVNYHVDPQRVGVLYRTVGLDYQARIIDPAVQETLKAVVAKFTAEQLVKQRESVKAQVDDSLAKRLLRYDIIVESGGVSLTDFEFSPDFNRAIEQKQVAQQEAEQQKYVLMSAQKKAQTAITVARGEAEANRIKAAALNSSGGQRVLVREWIAKWSGEVPKVVTGGGGGVFITLDSLDNMKSEPKKGP